MSGVEEAPVARCPKCGALVQDWHPYGRCSACKEPFSAAFDAEMAARLGLKPDTQKIASTEEKAPQPPGPQQWRIEPVKDGAVAFDCPACQEHYRLEAAAFSAKPETTIEGLSKTDQVVGRVFGQGFLAFVVGLVVYYYAHRWIHGPGVPLNHGILIPVFIAVFAYSAVKPLFAAGLLSLGRMPVYRYQCRRCQSGVLVASDGKQMALPVRPPASGGEPKQAGSGA
jgi:hypothetical protein